MTSILIKDTTREERAEIIRRSLSSCGEGSCEACGGCSLGAGDQFERFQPYVDGLKEISQINAEMAASHYELSRGMPQA
jgi:hypothetical protein